MALRASTDGIEGAGLVLVAGAVHVGFVLGSNDPSLWDTGAPMLGVVGILFLLHRTVLGAVTVALLLVLAGLVGLATIAADSGFWSWARVAITVSGALATAASMVTPLLRPPPRPLAMALAGAAGAAALALSIGAAAIESWERGLDRSGPPFLTWAAVAMAFVVFHHAAVARRLRQRKGAEDVHLYASPAK